MNDTTLIPVKEMDIFYGKYVVPMGLHTYGEQVGKLDEVEEIKKQIDEYLKVNEIYDIKCFQYNEHANFIRETIKCIALDENYNLEEAIKDYMQNYIDAYKSKHEALEEETKPVANFENFMDENRKIIEEIRQLKKQVSRYVV